MKIKPEFILSYEEGDISIMRCRPDGTMEYVSPLSDAAAMAWEGFQRGVSRESIIDAVVNEFDGAEPRAVAEDLDALTAQLIALGYAEE